MSSKFRLGCRIASCPCQFISLPFVLLLHLSLSRKRGEVAQFDETAKCALLLRVSWNFSRANSRFRAVAPGTPRLGTDSTIGEVVQRKYCEEGLRLDTDYFEKIRVWISAEADKRIATGARQGVGASEWNQIAHRVDEAKLGHQQSLRAYMDHVIGCPVCSSFVRSSQEHAIHYLR